MERCWVRRQWRRILRRIHYETTYFIKKPIHATTKRSTDVYNIEGSIDSDVVKFEVGQTYTCSGLYGEQIKYTVVDRTDNSVALEESHVSEDDWSSVNDGVKEYPIVIQNMYDDGYENVIGKQESVVIWEYSGHQGYLYAAQ